jgi:hypothetical protein
VNEENTAGPDEITKKVDVSAFQEKLADDKHSLVKDAKRALLIAALALSKAGDAVQEANSQIGDILTMLNKLLP